MPYKDPKRQRQYQLEYIRKRRKTWFDTNGPCQHCGSDQDLELHHIDRNTKIDHKAWSWNQERREAELAKCVALCANCHLECTRQQFHRPIQHGTHNAYASGCRCDDCRSGQKLYMRAYINRKQKNDAPVVSGLGYETFNLVTGVRISTGAIAKR